MLSRILIAMLFPLGLMIAFQNCTSSSFEQPDVDFANSNPEQNESTNNGEGFTFENGLVSLNLNNGDSVRYLESVGNAIPEVQKSVTMAMSHGRILLTSEIQQDTFSSAGLPDLPQFYCENSVLPICRHLTSVNCTDPSCDASGIPVACSQQVHTQGSEVQSLFRQLSGIKTKENRILPSDPLVADCDNTNLFFTKASEDPILVALSPKECLPESRLFAYEGHDEIQATVASKLSNLDTSSEDCNLFHRFRWSQTEFTYTANAGYTTADQAYNYNVNYKGNQRADLRFRNPGESTFQCASDVLLNEYEIRAFFPESGISYSAFRTPVALADAPTSQITYSDEDYGIGGEAKFYLNQGSASAFNGGAIVSPEIETKMKTAVETLLRRATNRGLTEDCP